MKRVPTACSVFVSSLGKSEKRQGPQEVMPRPCLIKSSRKDEVHIYSLPAC